MVQIGSRRSSFRGSRRCLDELCYDEQAYQTWLDCLVAQPNPKQRDIDLILDWRHVPKSMQDRDLKLWPGDPAASRARLQAIVDRELPRLKALEETLRVQYEEPARAAAEEHGAGGRSRRRRWRSCAPNGCTSSRMLMP